LVVLGDYTEQFVITVAIGLYMTETSKNIFYETVRPIEVIYLNFGVTLNE
jgi:hypothetical protein